MKPRSCDYKLIQTLLSIHKHFFGLQFRLKVPYLQYALLFILVAAILFLSYLSISFNWKLQSLMQNRLIFTIWNIFQLLFMFAVGSKHFIDKQNWNKMKKLLVRIDNFSIENNFTLKFSKWKISLEIILSYSIIILLLLEGFMGYIDLYTLITFGLWKITTFYMCFLFLLIRHVAAYIRSKYDFLNYYLLERLARDSIVDEKIIMIYLEQMKEILIHLSEFHRSFNNFFGSEIYYIMNIYIIYFANTTIFAFKKLSQSNFNDVDRGQLFFFVSYVIFHLVSK